MFFFKWIVLLFFLNSNKNKKKRSDWFETNNFCCCCYFIVDIWFVYMCFTKKKLKAGSKVFSLLKTKMMIRYNVQTEKMQGLFEVSNNIFTS